MSPPSFLPSGAQSRAGAALIITLMFLALIAVMIIAMSDTLRIERGASVSYVNQVMAGQMADRGLNHVTAILQKETGDINRNWISQPGQLVIGAETDDPDTPQDERKVLTGATEGNTDTYKASIIPLHTGLPTLPNAPEILKAPDLNISSWANPGENLIIDGGGPMRVKWVYVRENGDLDRDESPDLSDTDNPIIGRYAFWVDDESTKVNLNLAWSRSNTTNTLGKGSPTRISLAGLPGFSEADATLLHELVTDDNFATLKDFFNSPEDARRAHTLADKLRDNKFNVTHYNHDPQTTFFNEKRIVLTTQKALAGDHPFLDILVTDNTDPGWITRVNGEQRTDVISEDKLDATIKMLIPYLRRTDWPIVPENATHKSFQAKYFGNEDHRLAQLAIGIIEHVRSVESAKAIVEPIRVIYQNGKYVRVTGFSNAGLADTFLGNPRRFHITEMGIWRAAQRETGPTNPVRDKLHIRLYIEVHLPLNYGIDEIDLLEPEPGKKLCVYIFQADSLGYAFNAAGEDAFLKNGQDAGLTSGANSYPVTAANIVGGSANQKLLPGGYRTLMFEFYYTDYRIRPSVVTLPTSIPFDVRYGLTIAADAAEARYASRVELVPLGSPPGKPDHNNGSIGSIGYPVTITPPGEPLPAAPAWTPSRSVFVDDPRVNTHPRDWRATTAAHFGSAPSGGLTRLNSTASLAATVPPYDYTTTKRVTDVSMRMPYPKGHPSNPHGIVQSTAELGFIHTGLQGKANEPNGGTPWRTLNLQANTATNINFVPDWALMDLFTVPAEVSGEARALLSPYGTGAGRININAKVEPFGIVRSAPLKALLLNTRSSTSNPNTTLTEAQVNTIVDNILNRTLAGKQYGYSEGYDSPGEIVEISGIGNLGEDGEELIRNLSNLVTTRSSVFGIYTIGQCLKQINRGSGPGASSQLVVTSEKRQHAIIERYLVNGKVHFRTVYFRNINP